MAGVDLIFSEGGRTDYVISSSFVVVFLFFFEYFSLLLPSSPALNSLSPILPSSFSPVQFSFMTPFDPV